jgi:hypothetical protein
MYRSSSVWLWCLAVGVLVGSCTDTEIYRKSLEPNLPNKIAISGTVCTDDPSERQFPVRLMFIIDNSSAMFGSDSDNNRSDAVQHIVDMYYSSSKYSYSIVAFADITKQLTDGYTQDPTQISNAYGQLHNFMASNEHNWSLAISLARDIFEGDLLTSDTGVRSRTRYVFILLTNGPPPAGTTLDSLTKDITDMAKMGKNKGVAEFAFNTVFLDSVPGSCAVPLCGTACQSCDEDNLCPTNCAGTESCFQPQKVCSNDRARTCLIDANCGASICMDYLVCSDDPGQTCQTAGDCIGGGQCNISTVHVCTSNYRLVCQNSSNCTTGRCISTSVCNTDLTKACAKEADCCPRYNCVYPGPTTNDQNAVTLLKAMSAAGTGKFLRFAASDNISFESIKFTTTESAFVKKVLLVSNTNAKFLNGSNQPDSDGDGLSDRQEACYHEILTGQCTDIDDCDCTQDVWTTDSQTGTDTDPANADTDGDGLNDLIEAIFATLDLDPLRFDLPEVCAKLERPYLDSDGDGLNDCEEKILGTDPTVFDTNKDGFPDAIKVKAGANYLKDASLMDSDMDGLNNGEELLRHLDPQTNDVSARSGESYRYNLLDQGFVTRSFTSQPKLISGVIISDVSGRAPSGVGSLIFHPTGTHTADGAVRANPTLSWSDQISGKQGPEVELTADGDLLLYSVCGCVKDCPGGCSPGEWCDPLLGCTVDKCVDIECALTETCDKVTGNCNFDCANANCDLGEQCDALLHQCLVDRCLNTTCASGRTCDTESGICTSGVACQSASCGDGMRVDESSKPTWISVKVDISQLPQSGFWCASDTNTNTTLTKCKSDLECPANTHCLLKDSIVIGTAQKNCISFKVKNITLVETLETSSGSGFGAGLNNIFVYFSQVPLNNPLSYSTFREAQVPIRYYDGKKEPNVAEYPLTDGDFIMVKEP